MAALITAIDSYTPMQIGEKGHAEYSWSNNLQEKIIQLSFQFTRGDSSRIEFLSHLLREFLRSLKYESSSEKFLELITVAYKMIAHTRDIIEGKGEYSLAYMQILVWNEFYPNLAKFALLKFVSDEGHPFGSWKDIKYFCNYCKENGVSRSDPIMIFAFETVNEQLRKDIEHPDDQSLLAKWIPRSKSKRFGWIFDELALLYFNEYIKTAKTPSQLQRAISKCKMSYRKLVASLNKKLDTVQIKQCGNTWDTIDHSKTTSITISKQKTAFMNLNKNGTRRTIKDDRIKCAENFAAYIHKAVSGEIKIKGKRLGLNQFTIQAVDLIKRKNYGFTPEIQLEIDLLNSQWSDNSSQNSVLGPMIAMLDFSGSMEGDPLNCAMALGCRVAEKSILGKRVMSFSSNPTWHNLDSCNTFVEMIEVLQQGEVGYSTNFYKAFDRILDAIIQKKLTPDEVEGIILAIFSDMQIDDPMVEAPTNMSSFYEEMENKYAEAGLRLWNKPFKPPHILFWNLRSTNGFPCLSFQKNISMMSGFSPSLLNMFCEKGLVALQECTPWSCLKEQMNKERYKCMEDKVYEENLV